METYDVIIIGTGAGGGTLAQQLAPSGKRILILERGDYIPREKENWDTKAVFIDGRYKADEHWKDKDGKKFAPGIHYCVGGNTKVYGAALFRMRKEDFGEVKHHGGVSPAWPIDYEDLQPYYLKAEELYSVHGLRGSDPTDPHEEHPYYQPPLPHEPRIQELFDNIKAQGYSPFPLPLGLRTSQTTAEAPYVLDRFDGYPDAAEMKADSHVICIRKALEHPNVTIITDCLVERLETDAEGKRVEKVIAKHQGKEITLSAKQVVVACGAINSAVLLLKSANDQHKNGLANGSGVVGRHYMAHNNSAVLAVSATPNPTKFGKTLAINDFYFGDDDFAYPMGHIQMLGKSDGENLATDAPAIAPGFTLEYVAKHSVDFWMTSEDLPDPENRVIVSPEGHITLHYKENNIEGHKQLKKRLKKILEHAGCGDHILPNNFYLGKKIPIAGTAHQCGTVRFGTDPTTSALNLNCRAHEVDNLYVVDGSFFPSSSAINPGLTIIAMALKVGDHLKNEVL
ncbi:FAD-dependent oxidoreductase [Neolewinella persica]|uniref:FAD-dependent oxidoreductase n=1 Tax=Neolewinella persica TaxID=70998 RepID=UPI00035F8EE1|nr:GMC family oxidoreductase [Neolewinella persica]